MTVGHVGADDEKQVRAIEVLIRARRSVGTEGELVAAAGAGHAQAGIGFYVVGADETLGQLVDQVLGFQRHLPRHVERQCIGAVAIECVAQPAGRLADGLVHGNAHRISLAFLAQVGMFHPPRLGDGLATGGAFGAEPAGVGRVGLVAADLDDPVVFHLHDDAAAHTTIGTHTAYGFACHPRPSNLLPAVADAGNKKGAMRPTVRKNGGHTAPLSYACNQR
ncbi:hypothetical protein D3C76_838430 [compost metagenome]